ARKRDIGTTTDERRPDVRLIRAPVNRVRITLGSDFGSETYGENDDTNPLDLIAPCEAVAYFPFVLDVELAANASSNVVGFDGVDRRPGQVAVDRREIRLLTEHHVGGVFALVHVPVVGDAKVPVDRTEAVCHLIQPAVQPLDLQPVGDVLRSLPVGDLDERVVDQAKTDVA